MPETFWDRTKQYSSTAYEKGLKPGFDKAYTVMNKLESPVNNLTYKVGSESFWPGSLDKESEKAARILRSFCKDGFYDQIDEEQAERAERERRDLTANAPKGTIRVIKKIPAKVIQNAKGLAIFTCMRTGWVIGGSGGAGVLIGRHPDTGEWSPPSGIHMQNMSFGFLGGVDFLDTVLVINSYAALDAFTKLRCTLGTEVGIAAGPVGIGGNLDTQLNKLAPPVFSYVKTRGVYGGIGIEGNVVIERVDENERFYGERVGVAKILRGELRYPPKDKYKVLMDTVRAAQGENIDESLLPEGAPPSDMEMAPEEPTFGVPRADDDDPFGVKALEAEGLSIREAGTHRKATPETFEFRPSPTSPVYNNYRQSMDSALKKEWRGSTHSISSMDRGTQTDEDELKSPRRASSIGTSFRTESPTKIAAVEQKSISEEEENAHAEKKQDQLADVTGDKVHQDDKGDTHDESDDDDDYSDMEEVEIVTAVPVAARPKAGVVNVPKRIAPALPPRNPERLSTRSPLAESPLSGFDEAPNEENPYDKLTEGMTEVNLGNNVHDSATTNHTTHQAEDEFHSIPPSPMTDVKHNDEIAESFR